MKKSSKLFSKKIDLKLKDKLKKDLSDQGFEFFTTKYSIFSAKKDRITCTLYHSGMLVVQGKDKDNFIEFYLEPQILKSFEYTHPELYTDMTPRIGVDEAGKGDFFGPLCIASLYTDDVGIKKLISLGIKDSKKLTDNSILNISKKLRKDFQYSFVTIYPEKYNNLYKKFKNLNLLLGWAHSLAIYNLFQKTSCKNVIIDQFAKKSIVSSFISKKNLKIDLRQEHKAESDIVVAAASIIARSLFLEGLAKLSEKINYKLPKGASSKVIDSGVFLVNKHGKDILNKISKIHFKTYQEILKN
ncbi:MAG: ribonuclease HIII [Chlamydiae bacterium SM23_39]|nr:MAG: ribonuclease HIII [Chlamydiae bacterium SM23_39]